MFNKVNLVATIIEVEQYNVRKKDGGEMLVFDFVARYDGGLLGGSLPAFLVKGKLEKGKKVKVDLKNFTVAGLEVLN